MNAVTAEFEVRHHCQRQSVLKKEKHLSSSVEPNVEHCTLTNTCMQSAGLACNPSQKDRASGESEHARVQRWVHNDLKREWLCVIDDELRILPWQTPYSLAHSMELHTLVLMYSWYYPCQKKEPSSRFAASRTLLHVWYHARSGAISAGQVRSATVRDFCPALIAPDRAWYHTWSSVLLAANLEDGSFFWPG